MDEWRVLSVLVVSTLAAAQGVHLHAQQTQPTVGTTVGCFQSARIQRHASGEPVILTTRELDQMATTRKMPAFPPTSARITGSLRMKVLIDETGRIRCAVHVQGHPILAARVVESFGAWRFRPYTSEGKPISVLGLLDFRFEANDPRLVFLDTDFKAEAAPTPKAR